MVADRLCEDLKWELRWQRDGHGVITLTERGVQYDALPEWFREQVELESWDCIYVNAFWRLTTERSIGFSMGPIPQSKIEEYATKRGISSANMELFEAVIRAMDSVYMEWSQQAQNKARKRNKQPEIISRGDKTKMPKPRE